MIDNFDQIANLLSFTNKDTFYFCQLIKRKKEHPEMPKSVKVVHVFYIKSKKGNKNPMFEVTGKNNNRSKPVLQFDLNNNFIKEWENGRIAAKELKLSYSGINNNCNNKTKTSGKYIWKFK